MTNTTNLFGLLSLTTCLAISPAMADEDSGLFDWDSYEGSDTTTTAGSSSSSGTESGAISDAETSFKGAIMLKGDVEVTFSDVTAGIVEDDENFRYAFFPAIPCMRVWKIATEHIGHDCEFFGSNPQSTAGPTFGLLWSRRGPRPTLKKGGSSKWKSLRFSVCTLKRTMNSTTLDSAGIGPCRSNPMVGMRMAP